MTCGRRSAKCFIASPAGCGGGGKSATKRITTGLILSCACAAWGSATAASAASSAASVRFIAFSSLNPPGSPYPTRLRSVNRQNDAALRHFRLDRVSLHQLPGDDDALHLVGALADAHERRVAQQAL